MRNNLFFNELPSRGKSVLFILQIFLLIYLIQNDITTNRAFNNLTFYMFLILFGLTLGFKELNPLIKPVENSWKKTIIKSLYLFGFQALFTVGTIIFLDIPDPQGIQNSVYSIKEFIINLLHLPLVAIGEEFFKILMFLSIISFFRTKPFTSILLAIFLSSFIFGYMHVFGYKITAGLPIAIGTIPSFIFLIKYRSIYPLIIAHFITDFGYLIFHVEIYGKMIRQTFQFISALLVIITFIYSLISVKYISTKKL